MNQKFIRIGQILFATIVIAAVAGLSSCEKYSFLPPVINTVDSMHFQVDIQPIFNAKCTSCHGATKAPDLRTGKSFQALTNGAFITPPGETSKLYLKMIGQDHASRSSDIEKQKILLWINQGAHNNK